MGRKIAAVVLGYLVMFVIVFVTFSATYLVMGADRSFKPGTYDVTTTWVLVSLVLSFLAALAGGRVAVAIGRERKVAAMLAVVVVILGVILAIPNLNAPKTDEVRTAGVSNAEAMWKARQPAAVMLITPVIGAIGILAGGRMRRRP